MGCGQGGLWDGGGERDASQVLEAGDFIGGAHQGQRTGGLPFPFSVPRTPFPLSSPPPATPTDPEVPEPLTAAVGKA